MPTPAPVSKTTKSLKLKPLRGKMAGKPVRYDDLTYTQLVNRLSQRTDIGPERKRAILYEWENKRQAKLSAKRKKLTSRAGWQRLLHPLSYEISNLKVSIRYYQEVMPERAHEETYKAYLAVLLPLKFWLQNQKSAHKSVTEAKRAYEAMLPLGKGLPNDGDHWTDWIAPKIKRQIEDRFAVLPRLLKAKHRHPFPRNASPRSWTTPDPNDGPTARPHHGEISPHTFDTGKDDDTSDD